MADDVVKPAPWSGALRRWALTVLAVPAGTLLVLVLLLWTLLSMLFVFPARFALLSATALGCVMIALAVTEAGSGYSGTTADVAGLSFLSSLAAWAVTRVPSRRLQGAVIISCCSAAFIYALAKGASMAGPLTGLNAAAVVLGTLLPALQLALYFGMWRYASPEKCAAAERELLTESLRPLLPFKQSNVLGMHSVVMGPSRSPGSPLPIVITHGYAAGSGLFLRNMSDLAAQHPLYVVDWLGCASSSRPPFTAKTTAQAEDFSLDAFEAWRESMGLERFILVGHSLGGYLSAAYAMRFPERVAHLFLVSPAGIPDVPAVDPTAPRGGMVANDPKNPTAVRPIPRLLWSFMAFCWNHGTTPGVILRWAGPIGAVVTQQGIRRRASRWVLEKPFSERELTLLGRYMYHNLGSDGSGEFALRHLLRPGVWAHTPVGPRLVRAAAASAAMHAAPLQVLGGVLGGADGGGGTPSGGVGGAQRAASLGTTAMEAMVDSVHARGGERDRGLLCPVTFVYGGTHDWMDSHQGERVCEQLRALGLRANCFALSPAGHHVYLEAPTQFNAVILREIRAAAAEGGGGSGGGAGGGAE